MTDTALLKVQDLTVTFPGPNDRPVTILDKVSFSLNRGDVLGIVGESGCGKSVTAASIMRLLPGNARIAGGNVFWRGKDILTLPEHEMRRIRGNDIAMIFQDPMTSLNPVFTVGDQIVEAIMLHQNLGRRDAYKRCIEMLDLAGIASADKRVHDYPHHMSGGMRQRVMIAMALSCNPTLLIADEPTTALDVTIQAQILELLRDLQKEFAMAIILITHDLGVVAEFCDSVNVMYAGRAVENALTADLFATPMHPYTQGLMRSIPQMDGEVARLETIPGNVPQPLDWPIGCKFRNRCTMQTDICATDPSLVQHAANHSSLCHFPTGAAK